MLEGYSLPFLSEEALHVDRAYSVRFIIAALSYLADTSIPLRLAVLQEAYHQVLALSGQAEEDLSEAELQELRDFGRQGLYEVVEIINSRYGKLFPEGEGAYLVKLLDMLYSKRRLQISRPSSSTGRIKAISKVSSTTQPRMPSP